MSSDPQAVEDLYTKIALDNKLVTRFQVKKAAEELDSLVKAGKPKQTLGEVMVRLGFLTERQHQSVVNACRYREQRDYDKRFGRQCLRMNLLQQADIEAALDVQKDAYQTNGKVETIADILVAKGQLTPEQVESVKRGIEERDRAKARAGGKATAALAVSGPTPVVARAKTEAAAPAKPAPAPAKAPSDDGEVDLDDEDLENVDLDDEDLKDVDLDDDDLKDVDLDEDLDDDDLKDADLDLDGGDDADLEGIDLDEDLDDDDDEAEGDEPSAEGKLDIDPAKLDDLVERAAEDGAEDEADLAEEVSEIGSDVELDEDDLRTLERMDSGDDMELEAGAWAAEAFDDRPLSQRPPSERLIARKPDGEKASAPPPRPAPLPASPPPPSTPPAPPAKLSPELAATASSPFQSAEEVAAPPPPPPPAIPGKDVFDSAVSASASSPPSTESTPDATPDAAADDADDDVPVPTLDEEVPLTASEVGRLIDEQTRATPAPEPALEHDDSSEEEAALPDRLRQSARRLEAAMASDNAARSAGAATSTATSTATTATTTTVTLNGAGLRLDDPRVRKAFDKAMEAAWKVFLEELGG